MRSRLEQTVRQFAMGPNAPAAWLEALGLLVLAAGLAAGLVFALRRRARGSLLLLAVAAFTVLVPAAVLVTGADKHYFIRNVLVAWPLVAAVAATGLLTVRAVPLVLAVVVTLAGVGLGPGRLALRQARLGEGHARDRPRGRCRADRHRAGHRSDRGRPLPT